MFAACKILVYLHWQKTPRVSKFALATLWHHFFRGRWDFILGPEAFISAASANEGKLFKMAETSVKQVQ